MSRKGDRWGYYTVDGRECRRCGSFKPWNEYHKHSGCPNGRNTICRQCRRIDSKKAWRKVREIPEGDLYMVECQGYYKIGIAKNVGERICNMQTANPFTINLVKVWPGRADLESHVHEMLAPFHHRGEWFKHGACEL